MEAPSHIWTGPDGGATLTLFKHDGLFHVSAPECCDFLIDAATRRVDVHSEPDVPTSTIEHLLIDQVLPRCLAHDGDLVLHGAGVVIGDRAAVFLGESGHGKSTLTAMLQRLGCPILSDDCLQLEITGDGPRAWPTYPSLRLLPDMLDSLFPGAPMHLPLAGYSDKRRLPVAATATSKGVPVDVVYILEPPDAGNTGVMIAEVTPGAAVLAVTRNLFKLDPTDLTRAAALLAKTATVVRSTRVFSLRYPREITALPSYAAAIIRHVAPDSTMSGLKPVGTINTA